MRTRAQTIFLQIIKISKQTKNKQTNKQTNKQNKGKKCWCNTI